MGFLSVLSFAQKLVAERARPGEPVIDATVGGGVDTLFLAGQAGAGGVVYCFDIQREALERAQQRLAGADAASLAEVRWTEGSHAGMEAAVDPQHRGRIAAVMFNLGYLPGSDHATVTVPESTLPALDAALRLLRPGGLITAVLYTGHAGGQREADAVEAWAQALPQRDCQVLRYQFANQRSHPPYLLAIEKR
ncbi:SAM-dependent methyltransferase [Paenibacillus sp. J31TS4]|uniref:class I SAM-dependent methyltransferase n=1 Tax=Paenibacillus sp. J31TS4 TaxID=2807195 RepID=UPI001B02F5EA|nr:class I SAM-dependent methyltransferase [Paenibacillus sp. J31TS4]GIP38895.1 SAM-dependent methyltransferase [Paenibacillus sp. J31TS4]